MSIERVDLVIGGMTCASCANRVEKRLNRLDGVTATVNFATEKAHVDYPDTISTDDLLAAVAQAGYTADLPAPVASALPSVDPGAAVSGLGRRTLIAAVLAVPVIAMAMIPALQFTNWQWLSLVLAAPVVVWAGWPFHQATWTNLRHGAATMDTLISVGTISAFVWSLYALFLGTAGEPGMKHTFAFTVMRTDGGSAIYLEAAAGVTTFILLGRYLEERAKRRAGSALRAVLDLSAKDVAVLSDGIERRVPIGALAVGDTFVVRPGEKVATDGVVVEGRSALDASVVTGESVPVEVGPHDEVVGATINRGGRLLVRATRIGADTQLGILLKGPEVLESTRRVDTVVLDKTGTVTTGAMTLHATTPADGLAEDDLLHLAGSLEDGSEHPIARAVADAAARRRPLAAVERFASVDGLGVEGIVDGRHVLVGRPQFLGGRSIPLPPDLLTAVADAEAAGRTAVAVGWDGRAAGVLVVSDTVKPTSVQAVRELRALGLTPVLLTGDNEAAARAVATEVGIDDVAAGVLPAEKVEYVKALQASGKSVAMVGDGVNDAAALAQADLGIALGTGTGVAIQAGDLTLVRGDLRVAADAIRLARTTLRVIKGNLFWAFAYNVAAIPLAVAGFLNPMIAGLAMAGSSLFVVTNSLRLRRFSPTARS